MKLEPIVWQYLISFILTWTIGLFPPVLIRFLILRKPIKRGWAILVAFVFFCTNIAIFQALGSTSKTHLGLLLVGWASYGILRKSKKIDYSSLKGNPPPIPQTK